MLSTLPFLAWCERSRSGVQLVDFQESGAQRFLLPAALPALCCPVHLRRFRRERKHFSVCNDQPQTAIKGSHPLRNSMRSFQEPARWLPGNSSWVTEPGMRSGCPESYYSLPSVWRGFLRNDSSCQLYCKTFLFISRWQNFFLFPIMKTCLNLFF